MKNGLATSDEDICLSIETDNRISPDESSRRIMHDHDETCGVTEEHQKPADEESAGADAEILLLQNIVRKKLKIIKKKKAGSP